MLTIFMFQQTLVGENKDVWWRSKSIYLYPNSTNKDRSYVPGNDYVHIYFEDFYIKEKNHLSINSSILASFCEINFLL